MSKNVGACGLCRNVVELRVSHLLPAALYEFARDPTRTNPNPVMVTKGQAFTTSRQVTARFLCEDCEQRFSHRGERHVLGQCARPDGFRLRELLGRSEPIAKKQQFRLYDVAALLSGHVDEYLYFASSVFWRASAHSWSRFSLGDIYDEQFRLYLLGQGPFPANGRLWVHVWNDVPIDYTTVGPCTSKIDGERRHKFCIPGITFILFLGGLVPQRHDGAALNSTRGQFMWLCPFSNDSLFRGFADMVRGSRPSAALRRSAARTPSVPR